MRKSITYIVLLFLFFAACDDGDKERFDPMNTTKDTVVILSTDFGDLALWLYPETPLHRRNFMMLASSGFYNKTEFHRVVDNFVIQGGDPNSKDDDRDNDGSGGPGYRIKAEIDSSMFKHKYGAIGAARTGGSGNPELESSGSQFYIVVNPDGVDFLDGAYTVFGEVLTGMDHADSISVVPHNSDDLPDERVPMTMSLEILSLNELNAKYDLNLTP